MYLLNKVRCLSSETLYEVIRYDLLTPDSMKVYTVNKEGLTPFLQSPEKDFRLTESLDGNSYLLSSAEKSNVKLFDLSEFDIKTESSIFTTIPVILESIAYFPLTS